MTINVKLLETIPLFSGMARQDLTRIASVFHREQDREDTVLFFQSAPADKFYVVLTGTIAIRFKPDDGEPLTIAVIEQGGVFGWSAVLGRERYSSSAVSMTDCALLYTNGPDFRALFDTFTDSGLMMLTRLSELVSKRYDNTRQQILHLMQDSVPSQQ
ncbi:MAG: Crp/Fnr family transcriptional regulator [Anaerolineales bacterium]|nr:Crp/Fnr family transcriptional regulator [Anaerolineales bacterium]